MQKQLLNIYWSFARILASLILPFCNEPYSWFSGLPWWLTRRRMSSSVSMRLFNWRISWRGEGAFLHVILNTSCGVLPQGVRTVVSTMTLSVQSWARWWPWRTRLSSVGPGEPVTHAHAHAHTTRIFTVVLSISGIQTVSLLLCYEIIFALCSSCSSLFIPKIQGICHAQAVNHTVLQRQSGKHIFGWQKLFHGYKGIGKTNES